MSSTAVVDQREALSGISEKLRELREQVEVLRAQGAEGGSGAVYAHLSRDLFDLTTKVDTWADDTPAPAKPFGLLRVNDLTTSDAATLMEFYAQQLAAYLSRRGGAAEVRVASSAVARALHVTQDEIYYGITYGEQAGTFTFTNGNLLTLTSSV